MIIKELELENWKSYEKATIPFANGITIITGENGAGKSTILEAVHYALYKKNVKNVVRRNKDTMCVSLTFVEKGKTYKVTRKRKGKTSESKLETIEGEKKTVIAQSNKEVDNTIMQLIGMDSDLFLNASYIKQGEITDLIDKTPSERKKMIGRLLKIDVLERCWERMGQVITVHDSREAELKGLLSSKEALENELKLKRIELFDLENDMEESCRLQKRLDDSRIKVLDAKSRLETVKTDYLLACKTLENDETTYQRLLGEHDMLLSDNDKMMENIKLVHMLEKDLMMTDHDMLNNEKEALNSETIMCKHENNSLKKSLNELEKTDGKCPTCQSTITQTKKENLTTQYNNTIQKNNKTIQQNTKQLKKIKKQLQQIQDKKDKIIQIRQNIKNKTHTTKQLKNTEKQLKNTEKKIKKTKDEIKSLSYNEKQYNELSEKDRKLQRQIQQNIEKKGIIKGKKDKTEKRIQNIQKELKQIRQYEKQYNKIKKHKKLLGKIRETYSKNGIQEEIRANIRPVIQSNTTRLFKTFNFNYQDITLDNDYEITLDNSTTETNMLSGGEQIAIALALRLGITQTIAQNNIECILLDEPTVHLDHTRINELTKLFRTMTIVPQMLIVTHEEALEKTADKILKIEKHNGKSTAKNI